MTCAPGNRRQGGHRPWQQHHNHGRSSEAPARQDRRRHDGVQGRAAGGRVATRRRRSTLLRKKGLASAAKRAGRATAQRRGRQLHPHGRQGGRARRGELRDRLRRAHRRLPDAREGARGAHRGRRPEVRGARTCRPSCSRRRRRFTARSLPTRASRPDVVEKIVEGKLGSFYSQVVLVDQPIVRDPAVTVAQLVAQASAKPGENTVGRFARFKIGELGLNHRGSRVQGSFTAPEPVPAATVDSRSPAVPEPTYKRILLKLSARP